MSRLGMLVGLALVVAGFGYGTYEGMIGAQPSHAEMAAMVIGPSVGLLIFVGSMFLDDNF
ncbi:membrane protein [Mycobacterium phage Estes]|uniref:Membrane protein n=1 Tax=Mycobacterium phage Estes TaxID=2759459 RepID=A0A7G9A2G2_9CAUD|nr:membrane protein [Mycobacterium phage Estes]QNL30801.1 membrane protein [Mycobacterium phage Estes]